MDAPSVGKAPTSLSILIIGGTGFTGPQQVNYALARGHRSRCSIATARVPICSKEKSIN
jgi:hypothetical protein